jgi:mRNA-degrading endonuclease YafQ of YafQ-DinJ toxin-antitoxin module
MEFDSLSEFERDLKHLQKKYRTLPDDLAEIMGILKTRPEASPPFSFNINGLALKTCIIKVKKIACKALRGKGVNSDLRLIYAYFKEEQKITFIELYHKNDKENEDRERILGHFE